MRPQAARPLRVIGTDPGGGGFLQKREEVRGCGVEEGFIGRGEYYLADCEAAFRGRYIGDVQLVFTKVTGRAPQIARSLLTRGCSPNRPE